MENKSTLGNSPPPLLNLKSLLRPQGQIIDVKCKKSAILIFFPAIIELVRELLISNMHKKFEDENEKLFKLSRPQGQINDVKCEKSQ